MKNKLKQFIIKLIILNTKTNGKLANTILFAIIILSILLAYIILRQFAF